MINNNGNIDKNKLIGRQKKLISDHFQGVDPIRLELFLRAGYENTMKDKILKENVNWKILEGIVKDRTGITKLKNALKQYFLEKYSINHADWINEYVLELYLDESALNKLGSRYGLGTKKKLGEYLEKIGLPF